MGDLRTERTARLANGTWVTSWPWNSSPWMRAALAWWLMVAMLTCSYSLWDGIWRTEIQYWWSTSTLASASTGAVSKTVSDLTRTAQRSLAHTLCVVGLPLLGYAAGVLAMQSWWQSRCAGQWFGKDARAVAPPTCIGRAGLILWNAGLVLIATTICGGWFLRQVLPLTFPTSVLPWHEMLTQVMMMIRQQAHLSGCVLLAIGCVDVWLRGQLLRIDEQVQKQLERDERRESHRPVTMQRRRGSTS